MERKLAWGKGGDIRGLGGTFPKKREREQKSQGEPHTRTQALYPASKLHLQPTVTLIWLPLLPVPTLMPFPGAAKARSAIQTP